MTEQSQGGVAVASRVLQARQEAGLTTKALAERLDLSLWATERLERGEIDVEPYLDAVADATGRPASFFDERPLPLFEPALLHEEDAASEVQETQDLRGRLLILGSLVALVSVRFFTEIVHVLPRVATFIDIPIFVIVCMVGIARPHRLEHVPMSRRPYMTGALALLVICVISVLLNSQRVDLGPVLFFVYGFLSPLVLFYAVYHVWPPGGSLLMSQVLVGLGLLQLAVTFGIQVPKYISDSNPDVVSGTFGENAYQLVFFLLVVIGLLAAIYTFEKQRRVTRFIPLMVLGMIVVIFLAQFRALLITTGLSVLLIGWLISARGARGAVTATITVAVLIVTLAFVASHVPALKFGAAIDDARAQPTEYFATRWKVVQTVGQLYGDNPGDILTGTGPGTYSSRAWRSFTVDAQSSESAAFSPVRFLTGGRPYTSDVADKYVVPQLDTGKIVSGSHALSSPYMSYTSLLAEVGIFGFLALVSCYVAAFVAALRMARVAIRAAMPGDPLPALLVAATIAFFALLQMAVLENWLEVTRVTFLSWMLLAVSTKEFDARGYER